MPSQEDHAGRGSDGESGLAIRGLGKIASGYDFVVGVGETAVVGRSRQCDWSLRKSPTYLHCTGAQRAAINGDLAFSSVSREHARVSYVSRGMVEVRNLSGNGTLVDGKRINKIVLTDCEARAHRIQLGPKGVSLELGPATSA
jgi:pSer/pThr/pTyr-binding forkhead associated (FHA) protein